MNMLISCWRNESPSEWSEWTVQYCKCVNVVCFRFEWDKLLENVHCLIISVTKTDKQEAYILR